MPDGFQREVRPTGFVQYIQQPERGEGDGHQDHAGESGSAKFHALCLQKAAVSRLKGRDQREISKDSRGDPYHKHHNSIVKEVELLYERGSPVLQV